VGGITEVEVLRVWVIVWWRVEGRESGGVERLLDPNRYLR